MAGTAVVNVVIDPYDVLRIVDHPRLRQLLPTRPAQFGHDRMHKAHLVRSERPDGLLLGTSRAQVMLDPTSPLFRLPGAHGVTHVNTAVNGAQPYDALRLFQRAQALRPQKLLVYGLDMLSFDAGGKLLASFSEDRLAVDVTGVTQPLSAFADVGATVLSEDALRSALSTIPRRHEPSYLEAQDLWKGALVALIEPSSARGLDVELWDFQGIAGLHDEPPGGPSWWESSHATAAVGERVLGRLLGDPAARADFGVRLEPSTWRAAAARIRASAAAWASEHPDQIKEIQALANETRPRARRDRGCARAFRASRPQM